MFGRTVNSFVVFDYAWPGIRTQLTLIVPGVMVFAVLVFAVSQMVRTARNQQPDPDLLKKGILHAFLTICILIIVHGVMVLAGDLMDRMLDVVVPKEPGQGGSRLRDSSWFNQTQRSSLVFVTSGFLYAAVCWLALRHLTNDRTRPETGQFHIGLRFTLAVSAVVACNLYSLLVLSEPKIELWRLTEPAVACAVWLPLAVGHGWLLFRPESSGNPTHV